MKLKISPLLINQFANALENRNLKLAQTLIRQVSRYGLNKAKVPREICRALAAPVKTEWGQLPRYCGKNPGR